MTELALKLPPLLEARRRHYNIPDQAFRQIAMFDRVLLWQIEDFDALEEEPKPDEGMLSSISTLPAASKGSRIIMPGSTKARKMTEAPRGVIVTAGLEALDYLWAHGAEIGSRVKFVRMSPWHLPIGHVDSKEVYLQVIRVGDIVANEDLCEGYYGGVIAVERDHDGVHSYAIDGIVRPRHQPQPSEDY